MALVKIPLDQLEAAIHGMEYLGFCLSCGQVAYNVEPDARRYQCISCDQYQVYGAEEILIMGMVQE